MSNLDQPVPTRAPGENGKDFRNRARADYGFDPGLQDAKTDFAEAFTPRLAESLKPTSPLAFAAWNQSHPILNNPALDATAFMGGIASAITPSMFSGVNDQGFRTGQNTVQNIHELLHANGKSIHDARVSKNGFQFQPRAIPLTGTQSLLDAGVDNGVFSQNYSTPFGSIGRSSETRMKTLGTSTLNGTKLPY